MHPIILQHKKEITDLCERFHVRSLAVFGSAARGDDFDLEKSDADFLIEFSENGDTPALRSYFSFRDALADLLGRSVDLLDPANISNPYLLRQINQDKEIVYEA